MLNVRSNSALGTLTSTQQTFGVTANTTLTSETQTLTFSAGLTGGTFSMTYAGNTVTPITYSTTLATLQANIQTALNTLFGAGNATATGVTAISATINFTGALANTNLALMTAANVALTGGTPAVSIVAGTEGVGNEVQTITLAGTAGGNTAVIFGTVQATNTVTNTPALTQALMLAHLNTIPALNGNVTVLGAAGGPFTLVFNNSLANTNVPQLFTSNAGGLTSVVATIAEGQNELQMITLGGLTGGTALLSFNATASTDPPMVFVPGSTPTAAAVLTHLSTIPALAGNINVVGGNGGPFYVAFKNTLASSDQPQIKAAVTGGTTASIISQSTDGGAYFSVTFGGQVTAPIRYVGSTPPSASAVQAALNNLPAMQALSGPITVTSSNPAGPATTYTLTFGGRTCRLESGSRRRNRFSWRTGCRWSRTCRHGNWWRRHDGGRKCSAGDRRQRPFHFGSHHRQRSGCRRHADWRDSTG